MKYLWTLILTCCLEIHWYHIEATYCQYSSTCYYTTYTSTKVSDGWLFESAKYKSKQLTRSRSCTKTRCCSGYTGYSCSQAICFGSTSCPNGGTCTSPDYCNCPSGFASPRCNDINECSINNGSCSHGCLNTLGSYECSCDDGYTLYIDGKTCNPVCFGSTTCLNGGSCVSPDHCICPRGFSQPLCEDINECLTHNGGCAQHCRNTVGSHECYCESGLSIDPVTKVDCTDVNECLFDNGGCKQTCVNEYSSYRCECYEGYQLQLDGKSCEDVNECLSNSRCSQSCENNVGSFTCRCNAGYFLDTDGITCVDINECVGVICQNGASCVDGIETFGCKCVPGYEGVYCEKDINECNFGNGGCEERCINSVGSYSCHCKNGTLSNGSCTGSPDQRSIFEKQKIPRKLLPKGCSVLELSPCSQSTSDKKVIFSSTSNWYRKKTNGSVIYTRGIVFMEIESLFLPISVAGLNIISTSSGFAMSHGESQISTETDILIGINRTDSCYYFSTTSRDNPDLLNVFVPTYMQNLKTSMPNWFGLSKSDSYILSVTDLRSDILYGSQLKGDPDCRGAPLYEPRPYNVFRIGEQFGITILDYEYAIIRPKAGNKICVLVDFCHDEFPTVFLVFPPNSRDFFDQFEIMTNLKNRTGLQLRPRGIGFSMSGSILVGGTIGSMKFWNGDGEFNYRSLHSSNLWLDSDFEMVHIDDDWNCTLKGRSRIFIGNPDLDTLLTGIFVNEWNVLLKVTNLYVTPEFRFKIFGFSPVIRFTNFNPASLDVYLSIGGTYKRTWCGNGANPEGLYASFYLSLNPFENIPLIREWIFDFNIRIFAFIPFDTSSVDVQNRPVDIQYEVLNMKTLLKDIVLKVDDFVANLYGNISATDMFIMKRLQNQSSVLIEELDIYLNKGIFHIKETSTLVSNFKKTLKESVLKSVNELMDKIEYATNSFLVDMVDFLQEKLQKINKLINYLIGSIFSEFGSVDSYNKGFGLKFSADIYLIGLGFGQADIEFVYSLDRLSECSKFHIFYNILRGHNSVKVLARNIRSQRLGYFIIFSNERSLSIAFSTSEIKFVAHFNAKVSILGIEDSTDILISNDKLMFQKEWDVWGVFRARVSCYAALEKNWFDLTFNVQGEFTVGGDNDFGRNFLNGLLHFSRKIADDANHRLNMAKDELSSAQQRFTEAQEQIFRAQEKIRTANSDFDKAIKILEEKKKLLEKAKEPLKDADRDLREAQRKVDHLCRLRSCSSCCIGGWRHKTCSGRGWFEISCSYWDGCVYRIPDFYCESVNAVCRALRATAYIALGAARQAVRTVMIPIDIAKAAVSVAQFVVDKSRVALLAAEIFLQTVKFGLEAAKVALQVATVGVDIIKSTLNSALYVHDLFLKWGFSNLIYVRYCGFEFQLSITDKSFFDVSCDVKAFGLEWTTFGFEFDFTNAIDSMKRISKATVDALLAIEDLRGRRRRDIDFDTSHMSHHRSVIFKRNVHNDFNDTAAPDLFSNSSQELSNIYLNNLFKSRVEYFQINCDSFIQGYSFLFNSIEHLILMTREFSEPATNSSTYEHPNTTFTDIITSFDNQTAEMFGIDTDFALQEFNMSQDEINEIIHGVLSDITKDPYISVMYDVFNETIQNLDVQLANEKSVSVITSWIWVMENVTGSYFDQLTCYGYRDCVFYAFVVLYDVFNDSTVPGNDENRHLIMTLEEQFELLFSNYTLTIDETYNISVRIQSNLKEINQSNLWCSTVPVIQSGPDEQVTLFGRSVNFTCRVNGDPKPDIRWFFNDKIVENENGEVLILQAASDEEIGVYRCEAENILTNAKSIDMHLLITECKPGSYFHGNKCSKCAKGYFQNLTDQLECIQCDTGHTTESIGAKHEEECYVPLHKPEATNAKVITATAVLVALAVVVLLVSVGGYLFRKKKPVKIKPIYQEKHVVEEEYIYCYPECSDVAAKKASWSQHENPIWTTKHFNAD